VFVLKFTLVSGVEGTPQSLQVFVVSPIRSVLPIRPVQLADAVMSRDVYSNDTSSAAAGGG